MHYGYPFGIFALHLQNYLIGSFMRDEKKLATGLETIAGSAPTYVEARPDGFVAFFADELSALRVAYHYRKKKVTCTHRQALGVWSVTVHHR